MTPLQLIDLICSLWQRLNELIVSHGEGNLPLTGVDLEEARDIKDDLDAQRAAGPDSFWNAVLGE